MDKPRFRLSNLVKASLVALSVLAILSLVFGLLGHGRVSGTLGSFSLVVTLGVLVVYAHHTALGAKAASHPAVTFEVQVSELDDGPYFQLHIKNLSNFQARCWCVVTPRFRPSPKEDFFSLEMVDGMDFYEGESPCEVLPQQLVHGAAKHLTVFFADAGMEHWSSLVDDLQNRNGFPRLYLDIDFWYTVGELDFSSSHLVQSYYYEFRIQKLILDF